MAESKVASLYSFLEGQGITSNRGPIASGLLKVSEYHQFIDGHQNDPEGFQIEAVKKARENIQDLYAQMKALGVDNPARLFHTLHSARQ